MKVTDSHLFKCYHNAIRDALKRRPAYLMIDKIHMIDTWGSVTNGLIFYHNIFARLSAEFDVKFSIQTSPIEPMKFEVVFRPRSPF